MISENMLERNYLHYVNFFECIRRKSAEILFESNTSILIKDKEADMYLIAAEDLESAKKAIMFIPKDADLVLAHQEFYCDLIEEKFNFKQDRIIAHHSVWTSKKYIKVPDFEGELKVLTLENIDDLRKNYDLFDVVGEESISRALMNKKILGAFIKGKLCGFIGEHEEGSIGMLEVFKEYRRMGLGHILQATAINKALDEGRIPFGEVMVGNEKSMRLQKKLGLEVSIDKSYWLQ